MAVTQEKLKVVKPEPTPKRVCQKKDSVHYIPQGKNECYCGTAKRKMMQ